jgi:anti-sigma B factor antagonist
MNWDSDLKISRSEAQGQANVAILHVDGRINMSNAAALEQAAREAVEQGKDRLLLDLGSVPTISSAGLRTLIAIYKKLEPEAGTAGWTPALKLANVSPEVRRVLHLAGFDAHLGIYDSTQEALDAF